MTRNMWNRIRAVDPGLAVVTALAALLRLPYIGLHHLVVDETSVLTAALQLARNGQWTWRALNTTNWDFLPYHSPLSVYLAALPYLVSPDPRAVRLWVACLGVAAVALTYWAVRRSLGRGPALLAGLLLAAHTPLVDWSRYAWNANFAQPFIAAWLLSALAGYHELRTRAQTWHWLALSGAFQAHPAAAALAPLSLLFLAAAWLKNPTGRAGLARATLWGWLLFGASLAPWAIGLTTGATRPFTADAPGGALAEVAAPAFAFDAGEMARQFNAIAGSAGRRLSPALYNKNGLAEGSEGPGQWWPPTWIEPVYRAQAALSLAALLGLAAWGARRRFHLPALALALLGLFPFILFRFAPTPRIEPWYLMAPAFGAPAALGAALGLLAARYRRVRGPACALAALFVISQGWLTVATMRNHALAGIVDRYDAPLDTYLAALDTWQEAAGDREVIIFTETVEGKRLPHDQRIYWAVASAGRPVRVVTQDPAQGVPLPAGGALYAGAPGGRTIPDLFGPGNLLGALPNGEPLYRWALAPAAPELPLDVYPENVSRFANGARVLGLAYTEPPRAGRDWPVSLLWRVERTAPAGEFSFSVRLGDQNGGQFGQADGAALGADLWRAGDTVLNRFVIPVAADYPGGRLRVQVWMYSAEPAAVVDAQGAAVASYITLVRPGAIDELAWFRFDANGRYAALTSHRYLARLASEINLLSFSAPTLEAEPGDTLPLTLYWQAEEPAALDYRVFVHLLGADGSLLAQSDKVAPAGIPTTHWPADRYIVDRHRLALPPDLPPGEYRLQVGLWDEASGRRAPAFSENGRQMGDSVPLPITIRIAS